MLFKSVAKGLPGGSERIPVGFGKVRLRSAFAALEGEMLGESTIVEGASCLPGWDRCCGYGLIPDRSKFTPAPGKSTMGELVRIPAQSKLWKR